MQDRARPVQNGVQETAARGTNPELHLQHQQKNTASHSSARIRRATQPRLHRILALADVSASTAGLPDARSYGDTTALSHTVTGQTYNKAVLQNSSLISHSSDFMSTTTVNNGGQQCEL